MIEKAKNIWKLNDQKSLSLLTGENTTNLNETDKIYWDYFFFLKRLYIKFTNLFNGDKALGDNMNLFLNDNWNDILNELKPSINEAFTEIYVNVFNDVFNHIPYDEMFTD